LLDIIIAKPCRKKFDRKATEGVLVGYDNDDGYRIWCKDLRKVIRSCDVAFDEKPLNFAEICEETCNSRNLQKNDIEESSESLIEDFTDDVSEDDEDENEDEDRYKNQD
ncbi:hypothetical protein HHI36_017402, partial [Cryptolaemus montrouzieri]